MFGQSSYTRLDAHPLNIDFLTAGVTLWRVTGEPIEPIESSMRFLLKNGRSQKILSRLGDMEGAVRITSEAAALRYVRLLTIPSTFFMWHTVPRVVEIMEQGKIGELPDYGLKDYKLLKVHSGFMGFLSKKAFAGGHFSTAVAHPAKNGFVVSRWLLTDAPQSSRALQATLVQEEVDYGGAYRRRILNAKPAPHLPETDWYILSFE